MRVKSVILIFLLLSAFWLRAQPSYFVKEFGDTSLIHTGKAAYQLNSGSIIFGGHALNVSVDSIYAELTKLDENGNVIFSKLISAGGSHLSVERMIPDNQGNFLFCCNAYTASNVAPLILRVDTNGTLLQTVNCGSSSVNNGIVGIASDSDGCLLVSGFYPDSTALQNVQFFAQKFSASGQLQWTFLNNDIKKNLSLDCHFLADGRIILSGDIQLSSGAYNPFLICLDSSGVKQWELEVSTHYNSGSKSVLQDSNGDLVLVGEAATDSSPNFDIILSKIRSSDGTLLWHKYLRASNESDAGFHLMEDADHNYLLTGYGYDTTTSTKRVVFILTDSSGFELNRLYFGNSPINIGYSVTPSIYNGYMLAGTDNSLGQNILVFENIAAGISQPSFFVNSSVIFPNPVKVDGVLRFQNEIDSYELSDLSGKILRSAMISGNAISMQGIAAGLYVIRTAKGNSRFSNLLIIE